MEVDFLALPMGLEGSSNQSFTPLCVSMKLVIPKSQCYRVAPLLKACPYAHTASLNRMESKHLITACKALSAWIPTSSSSFISYQSMIGWSKPVFEGTLHKLWSSMQNSMAPFTQKWWECQLATALCWAKHGVLLNLGLWLHRSYPPRPSPSQDTPCLSHVQVCTCVLPLVKNALCQPSSPQDSPLQMESSPSTLGNLLWRFILQSPVA